jgi:methyltransferase (TIGR00027 family)
MARTDDDTWDLTTSVGATATGVAVGRALAGRGANALIDDPFAEPLVRAVGVDFFTRLATGELDPAEVDGGAGWGMAEMAAMMAVRTKLIDDFFTDAAASGIRQAVILASGLDARAYRLGWPAGTTVYEIDQPEVIGFKTRTLQDIGAIPTAQRRTVAIDLRQDWPAALRDAGFDAAQYLNGHGWETSETQMTDLFTANGFTAPASADDDAPDLDSFTYVTATRR